MEPLTTDLEVDEGETIELEFRLTEIAGGEPIPERSDVAVMVFAPNWQRRAWARDTGEGVYVAEFAVPLPGRYGVFVECRSLRLPYSQYQTLTVRRRYQ